MQRAGSTTADINSALDLLLREGRLKEEEHDGESYYAIRCSSHRQALPDAWPSHPTDTGDHWDPTDWKAEPVD